VFATLKSRFSVPTSHTSCAFHLLESVSNHEGLSIEDQKFHSPLFATVKNSLFVISTKAGFIFVPSPTA